MHRGNEKLKSIRIILPLELYDELKSKCTDHGDISKLVRRMLRAYLKVNKGAIGTTKEIDEALAACIPDDYDPAID